MPPKPSGRWVTTCSIMESNTYSCFSGPNHTSPLVKLTYTSPRHSSIHGNVYNCHVRLWQIRVNVVQLQRLQCKEESFRSKYISDMAPLAANQVLLLDNPSLEFNPLYSLPLPEGGIPFEHLESTVSSDSTSSYVYYQVNNSIVKEIPMGWQRLLGSQIDHHCHSLIDRP